MQLRVQRAVLRAVQANPGIGEVAVSTLCDADARDVERAVEILGQGGALAGDARGGVLRVVPSQRMWLTNEGRRVLSEEHQR